MTLEFSLVVQRPHIRDEFDEELLQWSRAVLMYCDTQKRSTAIQSVLSEIDLNCIDGKFQCFHV